MGKLFFKWCKGKQVPCEDAELAQPLKSSSSLDADKQARTFKGPWYNPLGDATGTDVAACCLAFHAPSCTYGWNASRAVGRKWWKEALKFFLLTSCVFFIIRIAVMVLMHTQCGGMMHPPPPGTMMGRTHGGCGLSKFMNSLFGHPTPSDDIPLPASATDYPAVGPRQPCKYHKGVTPTTTATTTTASQTDPAPLAAGPLVGLQPATTTASASSQTLDPTVAVSDVAAKSEHDEHDEEHDDDDHHHHHHHHHDHLHGKHKHHKHHKEHDDDDDDSDEKHDVMKKLFLWRRSAKEEDQVEAHHHHEEEEDEAEQEGQDEKEHKDEDEDDDDDDDKEDEKDGKDAKDEEKDEERVEDEDDDKEEHDATAAASAVTGAATATDTAVEATYVATQPADATTQTAADASGAVAAGSVASDVVLPGASSQQALPGTAAVDVNPAGVGTAARPMPEPWTEAQWQHEHHEAVERCFARIGPGLTLLLALNVSCVVYALMMAAKRRQEMRLRFGIKGSFKSDAALWLCCAPCALAQETRTLMHNNVEEGMWLGPHPSLAAYQQVAPTVVVQPPQPEQKMAA